MTSFYLFKGPLSEYSHILGLLEARASTYEFEEDTVQPITNFSLRLD